MFKTDKRTAIIISLIVSSLYACGEGDNAEKIDQQLTYKSLTKLVPMTAFKKNADANEGTEIRVWVDAGPIDSQVANKREIPAKEVVKHKLPNLSDHLLVISNTEDKPSTNVKRWQVSYNGVDGKPGNVLQLKLTTSNSDNSQKLECSEDGETWFPCDG